jgi:glycosylphosphatidylinositol transamidase
VLVTPLPSNATLALGLGMALLPQLGRVPWLARDVVWLAADADVAGGVPAALTAWLADYLELPGSRLQHPERFVRSGVLAGALVLEAPHLNGFEVLQLHVHGAAGRLPNMDVPALAAAVAGMPMRLVGLPGGEELYSSGVHTLPAYTASMRAIWRFLARQARGAPDGAHAAFLEAGVEAVTLSTLRAPRGSRQVGLEARQAAALQLGVAVEAYLRSLSNLLERLHHSSAFYILLSPQRFVHAGVFMPAAAGSPTSLMLAAAGCALRGGGSVQPPPLRGDWSCGGKLAAGLHASGVVAGLMLTMRTPWSSPACTTAAALLIPGAWAFVAIPPHRSLREGGWLALKSIALAGAAIALAHALIVNCAVALVLGLLLTPACLAARPAVHSQTSAGRILRWLALIWASLPLLGLLHRRGREIATSIMAREDALALSLAFGTYLPTLGACLAIMRA